MWWNGWLTCARSWPDDDETGAEVRLALLAMIDVDDGHAHVRDQSAGGHSLFHRSSAALLGRSDRWCCRSPQSRSGRRRGSVAEQPAGR